MKLIDLRKKLPKNPNPKRRYRKRKLSKINKIILHCSERIRDNWDPTVWEVNKYDVTPALDHHISPLGTPGFTYHYYVDPDGTVYACENIRNVTWHAGNHNGCSIGICIRYRATGNPNQPDKQQLEAVIILMRNLCLNLGVDPDMILGHRELPGTGYKIIRGIKRLRKTCPGLLVNMSQVRYAVSIEVQKFLRDMGLYSGRIDGLFGRNSEKALKKYKKSRKAG